MNPFRTLVPARKALLMLLCAHFLGAGVARADVSTGVEKILSGAKVIDVRSPEEFASGHIEGAINIPYDAIEQRLVDVSSNKSQAIVLYCRTGRRSGIAEEALRALGYTDLTNAGGLVELRKALNDQKGEG